MKKILFSSTIILALAACEDPYNRQGIGFTGIDGEPSTLSDAPGAVSFLPPATNVPAELAVLPTLAVTTDQSELEKVARVAIDNGGRSDTDSVVLTGQDTNLHLSTVKVNGTLYGVLRTPNNSTRVDNAIGARFGQNVEQFTGCLSAGDVFRKGSSGRSSGFAVPLNCS